MEIRKNAFGDSLVYENGVFRGQTLYILGIHKVCDKKGVLIGHIIKRDNEYISYDVMGETIEIGEFEPLLLNFFKQKKS